MAKKSKGYQEVDMDRIDEEIDRMDAGGLWKPKDGRNVIRILPPAEDSEDPIYFAFAYMHYNVGSGKRSVPCLRTKKEECYLCEVKEKMLRSENPKRIKAAKELNARKRYLMYIIDRSAEAVGPQLFAFGPKIHKPIIQLFKDPDYGDITSPDEGYDIIINREGAKMDTEYQVRPAKKPSELGDDAEEWLESLTDLQEEIQWRSYKEQKALFEGEDAELEDDDDAGDDDDDDDRPKKKKKKARDEEDDDGDADDDDEPVRKKKRKSKDEDDDDDGDDDNGDDDDTPSKEELEELEEKMSGKSSKKKKKKGKKRK